MIINGKFIGGLKFNKVMREKFPISKVARNAHIENHLVIDNRGYCTSANDQGSSPTCAAQSMAQLIELHHWKIKHNVIQIDAHAIYNRAKKIDGMPKEEGTTLQAVYLAAKELEFLPPESCAFRLETLQDVLGAIAEFNCCLLGFDITEDWLDASPYDGFIPTNKNKKLGGHAVLGAAYFYYGADESRWIGFQNSWGLDWGAKGFGRMKLTQFYEQFFDGLAVYIPTDKVLETQGL